MRYLLDTHAILWYVDRIKELPDIHCDPFYPLI